MTFRTSWISLLGAAALLAGGQAFAAQAEPMANPASAGSAPASAVFQTPQGEVTIRSTLPPAPTHATPPSFAQLAGKGKSITPAQAAAYPLLANDFDYADSNRDGRISEAEYARWVKGK
ncbi:MAG: hypothetical protein KGN77_02880 [Xanthomonadaceae bacterium]|nr:hypothetical protein [Xanthomonadaceae bacterium]MDE1964650.1 hypothetical protein [Xanthomonadaceae bacterium]